MRCNLLTHFSFFRYKSPSPGLAPPLPPHQPRSAVHHPFLQANFPSNGGRQGENGVGETNKKRVQSPRRRDFKDFSAPRDFRSPNRFNGNGNDSFLLPGYALSPDEDEDSGADSLNEQISEIIFLKNSNMLTYFLRGLLRDILRIT